MDQKLKELCAGFAKALLKAKNEADKEKDEDTKKGDETAKNEDVDKNKIEREIEALADKPSSEFNGGVSEKLATIRKLEDKLSYDKSSRRTADNSAKAKNEDVDKRKNIREVEAALFEKGLPKELVYWVTKLMEENSYDKSEAGTADNKAKNKCKNEDETKEGEYDKLKEEIFEEVKNQIAKNSIDALKSSFYEGKAPEKKLYVSQKEGLELGKQIYG